MAPHLKPRHHTQPSKVRPLISRMLRFLLRTLCILLAGYLTLLTLLSTPFIQHHALYRHKLSLSPTPDLTIPEQWGFLPNQATPIHLPTPDNETLIAWHIRSLSFSATPPRNLILLFHGAAGTLATHPRPATYHSLTSLPSESNPTHLLALDYRGFGASTGTPSERGLLTDAAALADWAMEHLGVPAQRIVLVGHSLGAGVAVGLAEEFARTRGVRFGGMVLVAGFVDGGRLAEGYRFGGRVGVLGPLGLVPGLKEYFRDRFVKLGWQNGERLGELVRGCEGEEGGRYRVTIVHAEGDGGVPREHGEMLFWSAVNATRERGVGFEELEREKEGMKERLGKAGWAVEYRTARGVLREEIVKWGGHDIIMSWPVVSMAVWRALEAGERV
ncbi:abhydrolase domain-containing protein 12 [Staphylotrichum tortipilum]|uniref:Abhydrolase domain-containing protein 12 n=1 Tax=Staphylotrichum tortipilum TaxID=2831512 RepID=A0AAN6RQ48_9PEZI|nr:abhydrolase domain-containing protein 12 [Staphylotrichum longicolle]